MVGPGCRETDPIPRAASAVAIPWLIGRALAAIGSTDGLTEAEEWFWGSVIVGREIEPEAQAYALALLRAMELGDELIDVFPYLLDAHAPGTRRSAARDENESRSRYARKTSGVFYTPSDVADYMTKTALSDTDTSDRVRVLDPACGTGVFLRSALKHLRAVTSRPPIELLQWLYGIDISLQTVEACAYLLTLDCLRLSESTGHPSPAQIWHLGRLNLAAADALCVNRPTPSLFEQLRMTQAAEREHVRASLLARPVRGNRPPPSGPAGASIDLDALFPEAMHGFDVIAANPPYAALGERSDLPRLQVRFSSLGSSPITADTNAFIPFVEMMWTFGRARAVSTMVVPLSLGSGRSRVMAALRCHMERAAGLWSFAFFDRTPDALFGDDVKQRVVIARRIGASDYRVKTTRLQRWTSRTRSRLWGQIEHTDIGAMAIATGIPRLGSALELAGYRAVTATRCCFERDWQASRRVGAADAGDDPRCLYVAGTAYNWLSVYRCSSWLRVPGAELTESPYVELTLPSSEDADAAYALLSSRLVYWLWRVEGDGFHVPLAFLQELPFSYSERTPPQRLQTLGRALAGRLHERPILSLNGGKTSVTYCPYTCSDLLDEIDQQIVCDWSLPMPLLTDVKRFIYDNMVIDPADLGRSGPRSRVLAGMAVG